MSELTTEEKIDYIYTSLKRGRRNEIFSGVFRWGRRLFILGSLIYFYYFGAQMIQDQVKAILKSSSGNISVDNLFSKESLSKIQGLMKKEEIPTNTTY